jgi:hypothetical protein
MGRSTLVSARLARFARDFRLRLACPSSDHVDVAAAAGEEDGKKREEAEPVALAAGSVSASRRRLARGCGVSSQGLLEDRRVREGKAERPCSRVRDAIAHHL